MPPKSGMTQAQKLEKMLDYFHKSATCHTLKDLEKSVPTATKINKMQIKDLLQELIDTNQVKVEKIGSGNWYWAWAEEEILEKRNTVSKLEAEKTTLSNSIAELRSRLSQVKAEQAFMVDDANTQNILARLESLEEDIHKLIVEKDEWENAVAGGVEGKRRQIEGLKIETTEFTNNVYVLEDLLKKMAGLDKHGITHLRLKCYGECYIEGEELADIDEM